MKWSCCAAHSHYVAGCPDCMRRARVYEQRRQLDALQGIPPRLTDPTGTRRRMQALHRIGWDWTSLGQRLNRNTANTQKLTIRKYVRRDTAAQVAALYDELWDVPGPSMRATLRGERRGWPPPLAWDDDTIDDPSAKPARATPADAASRILDEVAVRRAVNGDRVHLTYAERHAAVRILHAQGLSDPAVAERLGLNPGSVFNIRRRNKTPEQVAS